MCEPYHSIVQFEPPPSMNDDDDRNFHDDGGSGSPPSRITRYVTGAVKWIKKVGSRWHISRMGTGHTGAVGSLDGLRDTFLVPDRTLWESSWWNRQLKLDGSVAFRPEQQVIAQVEAKKYADLVSTGSLHSLRQFLEQSIRATERPESYAIRFMNILNPKGVVAYEHKLKQAIGGSGHGGIVSSLFSFDRYGCYNGFPKEMSVKIDRLVKVMLGLTRKRELLVPEWADDAKLWAPTRPVLAVT